MTGWSRPLLSAALAGAATGARSFTGLAALTLGARRDAAAQPDRTLARPWAKVAASALAATECGLDKLPRAPSRLAAPGLASRLAAASASAVIIARRAGGDRARPAGVPAEAGDPREPGIPDLEATADSDATAEPGPPATPARVTACVLAAVGAASATAWAGARWRAWASDRLGHDWIAAGIEDAAAFTLAAAAARAA